MAYSDYVEHTVTELEALRGHERCVICRGRSDTGPICAECFDPCDTVQGLLVELAGRLKRRIRETEEALRRTKRRLGKDVG